MVSGGSDIWNRIVELARDIPSIGLGWIRGERELTRRTDLVDDLGLVGDDAFEFMERFATSFAVKKGDYDASAYFDPEGLWFLPTFRSRKPKLHLTLGMLELAAKDGEWNSVRLNRAYLDDAY